MLPLEWCDEWEGTKKSFSHSYIKTSTLCKIVYTFIPRLIMSFPNCSGIHAHYSLSGFYVNKKVWKEKYYEINSFVVVISNRCFFYSVFVKRLGRKTFWLSVIHDLNPSGGFPSETVQFGFPYRIVVAATCRFMRY